MSVFNSTPLIKILILHLSFGLVPSLYQSVIIIPPKGSAEDSGIKLIVSKLAFHKYGLIGIPTEVEAVDFSSWFNKSIPAFFPKRPPPVRNISKLLNEIVKNDTMNFNMENDIIKGCLVTHNGEITHEMTKKIIKGNE